MLVRRSCAPLILNQSLRLPDIPPRLEQVLVLIKESGTTMEVGDTYRRPCVVASHQKAIGAEQILVRQTSITGPKTNGNVIKFVSAKAERSLIVEDVEAEASIDGGKQLLDLLN